MKAQHSQTDDGAHGQDSNPCRSLIWHSLLAGTLLANGCATLHQDRQAAADDPIYQVQVSGDGIVDQLLSVPPEGITVGEAIDAARADSAPGESAFVVVIHRGQRTIFPYATVASGSTSSIFLRPADRLVVTSGIVGSHSPTRPIDVVVDGLSTVRGAKTLFPDSVNHQFAILDMLNQLGVLSGDQPSGVAQAADLVRITRVNGDVWLLPFHSDAMYEVFANEGDRIELTAFRLAPEVIQGDARSRARMIVRRERTRRLTHRDRSSRTPVASVGAALGKSVNTVGRTVTSAIP